MTDQVTERLTLEVQTSSRGAYHGVVGQAEVDREAAILVGEFRRHRAPHLEIGEEVGLSLPNLGTDAELEFRARATVCTEDLVRVRYHFEVGRAVSWLVSKFSDRRLATRVQPYAQAPIRAGIERSEGGTRFPAAVQDISATGIGLLVPVETEPRLFSEWKARIWLQIPIDTGPVMEMAGIICSRRPRGQAIRYGIDFDSAGTADFESKQNVIQQYVNACQAAALYMFRHGRESLAGELARVGSPANLASELDLFAFQEQQSSEEFLPARELDHIAAVWTDLPHTVRQAILVLVNTASAAST
jgi:hypothetical protein